MRLTRRVRRRAVQEQYGPRRRWTLTEREQAKFEELTTRGCGRFSLDWSGEEEAAR